MRKPRIRFSPAIPARSNRLFDWFLIGAAGAELCPLLTSGLPVIGSLVLGRLGAFRFALAFRRPDGTRVLSQSSLRQSSRLGHEVILLRDARCPAGRNSVVLDGAFIIAEHFQKMGADRSETIVTRKPSVGIERP